MKRLTKNLVLSFVLVLLCSVEVQAKDKQSKKAAFFLTHESMTTPYLWQTEGKTDVSCIGPSCAALYTPPGYGEKPEQGVIRRFRLADQSIIVTQCDSRLRWSIPVEMEQAATGDSSDTTMVYGCRGPNQPLVYIEMEGKRVKVIWYVHMSPESTTYKLLGHLTPQVNP